MYRGLQGHINRLHDLDETAYKQRFGIPYGLGLICDETRAKHVELARRKLSAYYGDPAHMDGIHRMHEAGEAKRPMVDAVRRQRVQRVEAIGQLPSVVRPCAVCGNDVTVSGAWTLYADERIRCERCLAHPKRDGHIEMTPDQRERIRQWKEENAERAREYDLAKNYWGWSHNPFPLLRYAEKWGARLRIMPELLAAAAAMKETE